MNVMEGKLNDFLEGRIMFTLTPTNVQKIAVANNVVAPIPNPIDPRLQSHTSSRST